MGSWESALSVRWAARLPPYGHGTLTHGCALHGIKRWWLYLTQEQAASVAYGLWLHRMAGSAAEAIRASPASTASCTARRGTWAREFRPRGVERGPVSEYDAAGPAGAGAEGFGECGHKRRAARWRTQLCDVVLAGQPAPGACEERGRQLYPAPTPGVSSLLLLGSESRVR
ncbi:DUF6417 family protein [Streptomyces mirabilis]|uniref:DUF6417 family protein n=1 Tax=Streptomyces mirabilis TaxID=68239 RepID=UPI0036C54475